MILKQTKMIKGQTEQTKSKATIGFASASEKLAPKY